MSLPLELVASFNNNSNNTSANFGESSSSEPEISSSDDTIDTRQSDPNEQGNESVAETDINSENVDESVNEVVDYDEYAGDNDYDYQIDEDEDYFSEGSGAQEEEESDTEYVDVEDTSYDYEDYGVVNAPVDLPLGKLKLDNNKV